VLAALVWAATACRDSATTGVVDGLAGAPVAQAAPHEQPAPPSPTRPPDAVELSSAELTVRVRRQPWALEARVGERTVLRELEATAADTHYGTLAYQRAGQASWSHLTAVVGDEPIAGGQRLTAATTEGGPPAVVEITSPQPGTIRVAFRPPPGPAIAWTVATAASDEGETLLGLGERFEGVSLAGRRVELWSADRREVKYGDSTYLPVPWLLSSRGFGFLLDDPRRSAWEMRSPRPDAWAVGVPGAGLAFVLVGGPPARAIDRYTALTGRPPAVPPLGLGVVKTLVGGQARVLDDAARLRASGVPVDGVYVYDAYDEEAGVGWPHVTYDPIPSGTYGPLRPFTDALRQIGYRPLGYFGPDFRPQWAHYARAVAAGALVRGADGKPWTHPLYGISLIDATSPRAADWWRIGPLRRALVDLGFDGGMLDLGEAIPLDTRFGDGLTGAEVHNVYPIAYQRAAYQALQSYKPDGLLFMRSGWTGAQRYHAGTWSGDPAHNWDPVTGLQSIVPAGLGAGLAGYAYWHTEVGGYVDGGLDPAGERELYLRWLQLGAFTTMLRDQYGDRRGQPTDIWTDAETLGLWRRYARIHQALGPYLTAAAAQAQATGLPLVRHLVIAFPDDPRAWAEQQQYMLGDDLLVAPVVQAGARQRVVYLPRGDWTHWWTGRVYSGPTEVTVPAPQDQIPVFVRGGATSPLPDPASLDA
jgi:alpha-glucosidase